MSMYQQMFKSCKHVLTFFLMVTRYPRYGKVYVTQKLAGKICYLTGLNARLHTSPYKSIQHVSNIPIFKVRFYKVYI